MRWMKNEAATIEQAKKNLRRKSLAFQHQVTDTNDRAAGNGESANADTTENHEACVGPGGGEEQL